MIFQLSDLYFQVQFVDLVGVNRRYFISHHPSAYYGLLGPGEFSLKK